MDKKRGRNHARQGRASKWQTSVRSQEAKQRRFLQSTVKALSRGRDGAPAKHNVEDCPIVVLSFHHCTVRSRLAVGPGLALTLYFSQCRSCPHCSLLRFPRLNCGVSGFTVASNLGSKQGKHAHLGNVTMPNSHHHRTHIYCPQSKGFSQLHPVTKPKWWEAPRHLRGLTVRLT